MARARGTIERLERPALWLLAAVTAAILVFWALGLEAGTDPPFLILVLNLVFIGAPGIIVAAVAARGFRRTGAWPLLWLGAGALSLAIATFETGFLPWFAAPNVVITTQNLLTLFAALLFALGAFFSINGIGFQENSAHRRQTLTQIHSAVAGIIIFLSWVGIAGLLPPFFEAGSGGTPLHQLVAGGTAVLFLICGIGSLNRSYRSGSRLLYWFALSLMFLGLGTSGFLVQMALGTPLNWTARVAQLCGGMCLFATALVSASEAKVRQVTPGEAMSAQFSQMEARLKESEQRFRHIIETADEGIWVCDTSARTTFVNRKIAELLGYSRHEMLGKTIFDFMDSDVAEPPNERFLRRILLEKDRYEQRYRRKDGTPLWALVTSTPVLDGHGRVAEVLTMITDITKRKQAEEMLQLEHNKLTAILNAMEDGVCIINRNFDVEYTNPSMELQWGAVNRQKCHQYVRNLEAPCPNCNLLSFVNDKMLKEETFSSKTRRTYEVTKSWLHNADGSVSKLVMLHDITEHKKVEQLKDEFIGMVSHELKTPLTVIMGALATAADRRLPPEQLPALLNDAVVSSEILTSLVDNLLELSRQQSNRLVLQPELADLRPLAEAVVNKLSNRSAIHRLVVEAPDSLPLARFDPLRMERIIYNLVDNAIKYSPQGGLVKVSLAQAKDSLIVGVSDQGPGISASDQARLFQSFERLDARVKGSIQGTGLGLRVCRILVEAHDGRIWVESERGRGSTFFFTLPVIN